MTSSTVSPLAGAAVVSVAAAVVSVPAAVVSVAAVVPVSPPEAAVVSLELLLQAAASNITATIPISHLNGFFIVFLSDPNGRASIM
jgi:hypothetical protein